MILNMKLLLKMASFWFLYEEYKALVRGKKYILNLKRANLRATIELICKEKDTDVKKELLTLKQLYKKFGIVNYGLDEFFVNKIISVEQSYNSIYLFISTRY